MFADLWRPWFARVRRTLRSTDPRQGRRSPERFQARLEPLEDRRLLAVVTVTGTGDAILVDGLVTLREAILSANSNSDINADVVGIGAYGMDTINFDIPGMGVQTITPLSALPTVTDPVIIDAYTQPGASPNTLAVGNDAVLLVELNGNGAAFNALFVTAGNSTVRGLAINRFPDGNGVHLASSGNIVEGNFIGTNAAGTSAAGNRRGILVVSGAGNTIGGITPAARNLISGNVNSDIELGFSSPSETLIQGNYLGTDATGTQALGSNGGLRIVNSPRNTVGGTTAGARNVIVSGNNLLDIVGSAAVDNLVQGNFIGTNAAGAAALGSAMVGINIGDASNNTIGGTAIGARNIIATRVGVFIGSLVQNTVVQGNFIGTDVSGTIILISGSGSGVVINNTANNTIGGTATGAGNVIAGHDRGVNIANAGATGNLVQGNFIGTDITGTLMLGNTENGVLINGNASNNTIGGTALGAGNIIAFNGLPINQQPGVIVASGTGNAILGNRIFMNAGLGIDLFSPVLGGVTPNDQSNFPFDADTGANNLQNFPVIAQVVATAAQITVTGSLRSTTSGTFRIEAFASAAADPTNFGEGQTFVGSITLTDSDNNGIIDFSLMAAGDFRGQFISATATNTATNDTSEFSGAMPAASTTDLAVGKLDSPDPVVAGNNLTYTITVNNNGGDAQNVLLSDVLPAGTTFVSFAAPMGWTPATPPPGQGGTVTASIPVLPAGALATFTLVVNVAANFIAGGTIFNEATVTTTTTDTNAANDTGDESTRVCNFIVVNTNDSGPGSLREVIMCANETPGLQTITFAIPSIGPIVQTISPLAALPAITDPVVIDGYTQPGAAMNSDPSGFNGMLLIELNGVNAGTANGLTITAGNSTVRGLVINRFGGSGIEITTSGGNNIVGNIIGADPTGAISLGNGTEASDFLFLGAISTNQVFRYQLPATGNPTAPDLTLTANLNNPGWLAIGPTGELFVANRHSPFGQAGSIARFLNPTAAVPTANGTIADNEGVLRFNFNAAGQAFSNGVIAHSSLGGMNARGIGFDPAGNLFVAETNIGSNELNQFRFDAAGNATFVREFTSAGAGDHAIGFAPWGEMFVATPSSNSVTRIVFDPSGAPVANGQITGNGLNSPADVTFSPSGEMFVSSFNGGVSRFLFDAAHNVIANGSFSTPGGVIGVQFVSADAGVDIDGAAGNTIGGTTAAARNIIVGNGVSGVRIAGAAATGNMIAGNSIHSNAGLGIDLGLAGVTPNDPGDIDTGANNLQNFPVVTGIVAVGPNTQIQGRLNSTPATQFRVELFVNDARDPSGHGEGQTFLGFTTVTTDGSGNASIDFTAAGVIPAGRFVTATATDLVNSNTSEFSAALCSLIVTNIADSGIGSLREAIACANDMPNIDRDGMPGVDPDPISFAIPGMGVQTISPLLALPTITDPIVIDGYTQTGASVNMLANGNDAVLLIELNGAGAGMADGLDVFAGGSTVRGLVINQFELAGIRLRVGGNHVVEGNFIGTDATGTLDPGNEREGVLIVSSSGNRVGGNTPAARNLISGNGEAGVAMFFSSSLNVVLGNFIGTDRNGTAGLGNSTVGVLIISDTGSNTIGGSTAADRNIISDNQASGVQISNSAGPNFILGNYIGTDVTGTLDLGNGISGVFLGDDAPNTRVGGTRAGEGNLISGNNSHGIAIFSGTEGTLVQGNRIGTDVSGLVALGNSKVGVIMIDSSLNTIGGPAPTARNIISGNESQGVFLTGSQTFSNVVQGNFIGTDITGLAPLGNGSKGVFLEQGANLNTLGGLIAGAGNTIAFNDGPGIAADFNAGVSNAFLGNSIFANDEIGIDLGFDFVTDNDLGDGDTGPNNLQNFPVFDAISELGGDTQLLGTLNSTAATQFRIEFFLNNEPDSSGFGEGETFLGFQNVTTNVDGDADIDFTVAGFLLAGRFITATATDPQGNTSEFSAAITARDFGDAPDTYHTLLSSDGARHVPIGPTLGIERDGELDANAPLDGTGDDVTDVFDEDGVFFVNSMLFAGDLDSVDVEITGSAGDARLYAWIDFNRDGDFDDGGEQIIDGSTLLGDGFHAFGFTIPADASPGNSFARFRLSTQVGLGFDGLAGDGEVEDYAVQICSLIVTTMSDVIDPDDHFNSLREAILCANDHPGADTITVPAGTYELEIAGTGENSSFTGDLDITDHLTINGVGAATTIVDGNDLDRVFQVLFGRNVTFSGVTIRNGNTSTRGGGILQGGPGTGTLTIRNSVISGNQADAGGGISTDAILTVEDSTISGNSAIDVGGGIELYGGSLTLRRSTIDSNVVTDAESDARGGGIYVDDTRGPLTIEQSTISRNSAPRLGGGIYLGSVDHAVLIINSTISTNSASEGGGIYVDVFESLDFLTVQYSTIASNSAVLLDLVGGRGGGIFENGETVVLQSTIVGNNTAATAGQDLFSFDPDFTFFVEFSLIEDVVGGQVIETTPGTNFFGLDPLLGPLAVSGGTLLIETHALLAGSRALNTANPASFPATDQRGVARPQGPAPDMGAFESQAFAELFLSINDVVVTEGNVGPVNAVFTVTLSAPTSVMVTVVFTTDNVSATAVVDYQATTGTLTFAPLQTVQNVTVPVIGDTLDEADEVFRVDLSNGVNATISDGIGLGTIVDDDAPPALSINDRTVTEGTPGSVDAVFSITLSAPSGLPISVVFTTANGSALAGSDYLTTTGTLSFAALETSRTVTVTVNGDTLDELDETFTVTLSGELNATILDGQGLGTIFDDDAPPSMSIDDHNVTEGNLGTVDAVFSVTLSAPSGLPISVVFTTANGSATAGSDYLATTGTLSFAALETSQTVTVRVNGDTLDELDETFNVNLSGEMNATILDGQGVGTIVDDDAPPALSINDRTVTEGTPGSVDVVFSVTLSAQSGLPISVVFTTANGSALAGSDYPTTTGTLSFAALETSQTVTVQVNGDMLDELNETFFVNLSNLTNATLLDGQGQGTIFDDDAPPALSISDSSVTEGNTGTNGILFSVTLSAPSGLPISVVFTTASGSAFAGSDYLATAGTLSFAALETSKTVIVLVNGDTLDELNETFTVNLSGATNATILDGQGQGTIFDDDAPPTLSINDVSMIEGDQGTTDMVFTVTLSEVSGKSIRVEISTADGTASEGDYQGFVLIAELDINEGSRLVTVPLRGDTLDEPNETFTVNLTNAENATIADGQGVGTILDDDAPPALSIGDRSVGEGNAGTVEAVFSVTLSAPSGQPISVVFTTADGSASSGSDYQTTSGTLSFAPMQTVQSVTVQVNGDTAAEANETFQVILSGESNVTIDDGQGVGTILDDDARSLFVTGADAGGGPHVKVFDASTSQLLFGFMAYNPLFGGGVRVAVGDVNGDGTDDVITGAGPGGGPHVRVFDGRSGAQLPGFIGSFMAYNPLFGGGVYVAAGDVNGDGAAEVITGADAGGGPHVRVFDGRTGAQLAGRIGSFFAYKAEFNGGVRVAAGDVNGDGFAEVITGMGPGYGDDSERSGFRMLAQPEVRVFSGADAVTIRSFLPFEPGYRGGVHLSVGHIDADAKVEIIVGKANGDARTDAAFDAIHVNPFRRSEVSVFQDVGPGPLNRTHNFVAYPHFPGSVRVAAVDRVFRDFPDFDPTDDYLGPALLTAPGRGGGPHVKLLADDLSLLDEFFAYDELFGGGVFVAGSVGGPNRV